jgi:quercetin dioxygenase-like cupin family protein
MSNVQVSLENFLGALRRRYASGAASAAPAFASELQALLAVWPGPAPLLHPVPSRSPAYEHLGDALAAGRRGTEASLATALAGLSGALAWGYGYPDRSDAPDLSSRVAFCEIVGPGGLLPSNDLRLGLTLIAPATHYPAHAHPAIETYLVVAGSALWQQGSDQPEVQPPGALIFHPSNISHAMRTDGDPLLAIYSWRGDLASPSVYLDT